MYLTILYDDFYLFIYLKNHQQVLKNYLETSYLTSISYGTQSMAQIKQV